MVDKGRKNVKKPTQSKVKKQEEVKAMNTKKLSKSIRIFIRREKARIRRSVFDLKEQEKLISGLYQQFH